MKDEHRNEIQILYQEINRQDETAKTMEGELQIYRNKLMELNRVESNNQDLLANIVIMSAEIDLLRQHMQEQRA